MALRRNQIYVGQTVICVEPFAPLVCGAQYTISHIWDTIDNIKVDEIYEQSWSFKRFDIAVVCTPQELVDTLLLFAQWLVKPRPLQVGELVHVMSSREYVYEIVAIHADLCWIRRDPNSHGFIYPTSGLFRADDPS